MLKDILENALPTTLQDVVIVFVTVSGRKNGHLVQETYANKIYSRRVGAVMRSAIQITTASAICAVLDMLAHGDLPARGFMRQEDIGSRRLPCQPFRPCLRPGRGRPAASRLSSRAARALEECARGSAVKAANWRSLAMMERRQAVSAFRARSARSRAGRPRASRTAAQERRWRRTRRFARSARSTTGE